MKKLILSFIIALALFSTPLLAQSVPPKREFRAVWIASVTNLDWPSSRTLSSDTQRSTFGAMLDQLKAIGINTIVFQIRPECDALYASSYEPWSYWLTGQQGKAPNPFYDPLEFAVQQAHKRGMEIHAWFNPYRAVRSVGSYAIDAGHVSVQHPDWILTFGTLKMLDPGLPAVRTFVTNVIVDVLRRYDIDGVHWDDYFYPYSGTTNQDSVSWNLYHGEFTDKASWRRNNVNQLVRAVRDSILAIKPKVKFGISPFGIWKSGVPSGITGLSSYDVLYCDAVTWMSQLWLDYLTPQLYWPFGGGQDYGKLMPWWSSQINGRHLYPGQAAYRITDGNWSASELPNQIRLNRAKLSSPGSVFFRANYGVINNPKGFADSLRNDLFKYPALIPAMPWKDSVPPNPPMNLSASGSKTGVTLEWLRPPTASDGDEAKYFVIYRSTTGTIDINDAQMIRSITTTDSLKYVDAFAVMTDTPYTYVVSAVDKLHNESLTSNSVTFTLTEIAEKNSPAPYEYRLDQNFPNPFNPTTTVAFTLKQQNPTTLKVFDILGREIATLVDEVVDVGTHFVPFNGSTLASGVYFYRLRSGNFVETKKMLLQK